jgi:hypothetical protein
MNLPVHPISNLPLALTESMFSSDVAADLRVGR